MKFISIIILFILLSLNMGCGKKSSLSKYPDSDFPRNYPKND